MHPSKLITLSSLFLFLGFIALSVLPNEADAGRFGGGSSVGSRGSRSFSTPRQATPRQATTPQQSATAASPTAGGSRWGSGLMGGIGGFMLGGLLGSMLFGGGLGSGGGLGLLEILLIGGAIWFLFRWFKRQKGQTPAPIPLTNQGEMFQSYNKQSLNGGNQPDAHSFFQDKPAPQNFAMGAGSTNTLDEVSQGLAHIMSMDPNFNETQFLNGAKAAYQLIQGAWSDWSVGRLQPLLTQRMWGMIQAQASQRQAAGRRDIVEKIRFDIAQISEAWQEAGDDWITVHFIVDMVEYETDVQGQLLNGNPNVSIKAEEYWTFCRPVGSKNPNWLLSAIQQPNEVARSVQ